AARAGSGAGVPGRAGGASGRVGAAAEVVLSPIRSAVAAGTTSASRPSRRIFSPFSGAEDGAAAGSVPGAGDEPAIQVADPAATTATAARANPAPTFHSLAATARTAGSLVASLRVFVSDRFASNSSSVSPLGRGVGGVG